MARVLLVALFLAGGALAAQPRQQVVRLPAAYGTATEVTAFVPSVTPASPVPLVLMLSGYCLARAHSPLPGTRTDARPAPPQPAQLQDDMQLRYAALVEAKQFVYVPLKSPRTANVCALCPTTIRAADLAGNMQMYSIGARLTAAITAAGMCTAWDATDACCQPGSAGRNGGDVGFIKTIIQAVAAKLPIDTRRVYVVGIANGGFLAQRLACDEPGLFRGIVAYASGLDATKCTAPARVPLLLMHGDADVIVPFAGGYNSANIDFPGFVATGASWKARNECTGAPTISSWLAAGPARGDENYTVQSTQYGAAACRDGARVGMWEIVKGQHFALPATSAVLFGKALEWVMQP